MKVFIAILWLLTLGCWGFMLLMTHGTPDEVQQMPTLGNDTLDHLLAFGVLGGLLSLGIWAIFPKRPLLLALGLPVLLAYAAIDEWTRHMMAPHALVRHWLADAAGAAIAVTSIYLFCGLSGVLRRPGPPDEAIAGTGNRPGALPRANGGLVSNDLGSEVESALACYTDADAEVGEHIIRVEKASDPSSASNLVRAKPRRLQ